ncbi:MAG: hypothetical protein IPJ84_07435 [Bdellovibrionales bacterium]|nr:hypothetical protein [Bdellovibrionales bacterium]
MKSLLLVMMVLFSNSAFAAGSEAVVSCGETFWGFGVFVSADGAASAHVQSGYSSYSLKDCVTEDAVVICQANVVGMDRTEEMHKVRLQQSADGTYSGVWSRLHNGTETAFVFESCRQVR